jgi:hypothetical protein
MSFGVCVCGGGSVATYARDIEERAVLRVVAATIFLIVAATIVGMGSGGGVSEGGGILSAWVCVQEGERVLVVT